MLNSTPKYCCLETENITRGIWTTFYLEASSFQNIFDFNREHEYLSSWKHNYNLLVTNRSLICDNNRLFVCGHKVVFLRKCIHMTSCIWCRQSMELQVLCIWLQKKIFYEEAAPAWHHKHWLLKASWHWVTIITAQWSKMSPLTVWQAGSVISQLCLRCKECWDS